MFVGEGEPPVCSGWHAVRDESGAISLSAFAATPPEEPEGAESQQIAQLEQEIQRVNELLAQSHTKAELAQLIAEQRQAIEAAKVDAKMADLDFRRKQAEVSDGTVRAACDGVVTQVNGAPEADQPLITLSAGGGYVVQVDVPEFDVGSIKAGQTMAVTSQMTGAFCEGVVESVGTQPNGQWMDMGGLTQSTYPVVVRTPEDGGLVEGDYAEVVPAEEQGAAAEYIPTMFVRFENGEAYVYVKGEGDRLEKRFVTVGANLWGELTQIKGGLSESDALAFPYGTDVREGAQTKDGAYEDLWAEAI